MAYQKSLEILMERASSSRHHLDIAFILIQDYERNDVITQMEGINCIFRALGYARKAEECAKKESGAYRISKSSLSEIIRAYKRIDEALAKVGFASEDMLRKDLSDKINSYRHCIDKQEKSIWSYFLSFFGIQRDYYKLN